MKRGVVILTGIMFLLGLGTLSYSQEAQQKPQTRERLRNAMEIRQEMRKIEKDAIEKDAELQGIMNKINEQHQLLRQKLDAKLANNSEYQQLKKQLDDMKAEWKERRPEGPPSGPPPAPQAGKTKETKVRKGK
ncbi:MAG: hypothetical protein PHI44_04595 [Candidatus Ratteibacteria bacterium]|nr:hypothetical protein [Candidatus Ratteibacteria bacterium]